MEWKMPLRVLPEEGTKSGMFSPNVGLVVPPITTADIGAMHDQAVVVALDTRAAEGAGYVAVEPVVSATTRKMPTNGAPNLAINGALVVRH